MVGHEVPAAQAAPADEEPQFLVAGRRRQADVGVGDAARGVVAELEGRRAAHIRPLDLERRAGRVNQAEVRGRVPAHAAEALQEIESRVAGAPRLEGVPERRRTRAAETPAPLSGRSGLLVEVQGNRRVGVDGPRSVGPAGRGRARDTRQARRIDAANEAVPRHAVTHEGAQVEIRRRGAGRKCVGGGSATCAVHEKLELALRGIVHRAEVMPAVRELGRRHAAARAPVVDGVAHGLAPGVDDMVGPRVAVEAKNRARVQAPGSQPNPGFQRSGLIGESRPLHRKGPAGAAELERLSKPALDALRTAVEAHGISVVAAIAAHQDERVRTKGDQVLLRLEGIAAESQGLGEAPGAHQNPGSRRRIAVRRDRQLRAGDLADVKLQLPRREGGRETGFSPNDDGRGRPAVADQRQPPGNVRPRRSRPHPREGGQNPDPRRATHFESPSVATPRASLLPPFSAHMIGAVLIILGPEVECHANRPSLRRILLSRRRASRRGARADADHLRAVPSISRRNRHDDHVGDRRARGRKAPLRYDA